MTRKTCGVLLDSARVAEYDRRLMPALLFTLAAALVLGLAPAPAQAATVHYFTGWSDPHVHFQAGGSWTRSPGVRMMPEGGGWYVADTGAGVLREHVFTDGRGRWDHAPGGANYRAPAGAAEIWVRGGRVTLAPPEVGRIETVDVPTALLGGGRRRCYVYLPAWYDRRQGRRYPVLYLQDGQNLFNRQAFWGGWQADAAVEAATQGGAAEPVILVGIASGGRRMSEYTPTFDTWVGAGGGADRYLDFVAWELKPWIDARYRTRGDAGSTGIGGSSLGGLLALYAGLTRPAVFGRVLAMSPALWWDNEYLIRVVQSWQGVPQIRVYLDSGGARDGAADVFTLRDLLAQKGLRFGSTLWHWYEPTHDHNEVAWRARLPRALSNLFPR